MAGGVGLRFGGEVGQVLLQLTEEGKMLSMGEVLKDVLKAKRPRDVPEVGHKRSDLLGLDSQLLDGAVPVPEVGELVVGGADGGVGVDSVTREVHVTSRSQFQFRDTFGDVDRSAHQESGADTRCGGAHW